MIDSQAISSQNQLLSKDQIIETLHIVGTHPPLSTESLNKLVGITAEERNTIFKQFGLHNHEWNTASALTSPGIIEQKERFDY
jgi:hypothetical protein